MISGEPEIGLTYYSRSGRPFEVLGFTRHGLDCNNVLVRYVNIEPTADFPAGQEWSLEVRDFKERFNEKQ